MVDNLNRKLILIFGALAVAVISLLLLPFRLGLDLQGGTRLTYSVDLEKARAEKLIPDGQTDAAAIEEIIKVWRERVDPKGVKGVTLRKEGSNRIVIELPGSESVVAKKANSTLAQDFKVGATVEGDDSALVLADDTSAADFPASGGRIQVAGKTLRYGRRIGKTLYSVTFVDPTERAAIPAGAATDLEASDPWRSLIENTGRMEVMMHATTADAAGGFDLTTETDKAREWSRANPNASITDYNAKLAEQNPETALGRLRFFPRKLEASNADTQVADRLVALIVESNPKWIFSGSDFTRVFGSFDRNGRPAVGFDIATNRHEDFEQFTTEHEGEQMAIVIDNEIVTDPNLNQPLRTGGIITGGSFGFAQAEVNDLVNVLNSGSLDLEPQFEDRETVGATLGATYVKQGFFSVVIGLVAVLAFIAVYYKRLGVYAAISLVFNLVLLMGAMAVLQATLTLPGVAGIILTVGMAVDANILIYERIREEALKGRRPAQSAKDGFANALSTIVDANLTTLITAVILYKFGSGPVQGFATTLIVGILTSMFSALVVTRVMVHYALEKGVERWDMARAVQDTNIDFMGIAKKSMIGSAVLIVLGVVFFSTIPRVEKYSIDFLGGNSMQLTTAKAETQESVASKIAGLGDVFTSATVQPLLSSAAEGGYRKFQVEFKSEETADSAAAGKYRAEVETRLVDFLAPNRFVFDENGTGTSGTIYFENEHTAENIQAVLSGTDMGDLTVTPVDGSQRTFRFETPEKMSSNVAGQKILDAFANKKDPNGVDFTLAQPIPQSASVGPQVVQQLRDDAILAIILSLFAVVMYIRFRFAEYSYGFAAVIALLHDVLMTVGFLAIAIKTQLINAQVSLVMIAAFLTIIGYSLNDTIVVFDRIRENLKPLSGKIKLSEIINRSINQTLARTVLTSLTTMITVMILFFFNVGSRSDLEGFSYAVIIGVIVGTYSSMFIASPALLWLEGKRLDRLANEPVEGAATPSLKSADA
ncbi:bifunctional preprotein translocase subunit SecD/SecF [Planctomycetes bacterium Poly30]|uniref:Multifunctional fusion protein n=1 Tax=Saltatorellus ferox TaxID=2528018 RepID=A0A518ERC1_9BACT|nr:bifunctional preprotein translocase subunit SecD/SecF [Planctomycetes bacterium Poly30]